MLLFCFHGDMVDIGQGTMLQMCLRGNLQSHRQRKQKTMHASGHGHTNTHNEIPKPILVGDLQPLVYSLLQESCHAGDKCFFHEQLLCYDFRSNYPKYSYASLEKCGLLGRKIGRLCDNSTVDSEE